MFRNLNKKVRFRLIVSFISMSIIYMFIMPFGSYNPLQFGFYASIFTAALWTLIMGWYFNKYHKDATSAKNRKHEN